MSNTFNCLELPILTNGLDFILTGLENLDRYSKDEDSKLLKYAVINIYAGIELVLKFRLAEEHWTLIFDKPNDAKIADYTSGEFSSVTYGSCTQRLENICNISLTGKQKKRIDNLRKMRNRFDHFKFSGHVLAIKKTICEALSSLIDFIQAHIQTSTLSLSDQESLKDVRDYLHEIEDYLQQRLLDIQAEIAAAPGILIYCPTCRQKAAKANDGIVNCYLCRNESELELAINTFIEVEFDLNSHEHIVNGGEWPVYECPYCNELAFVSYYGDINKCFSCGTEYSRSEFSFCDICDQPYCPNEYDLGHCANCHRDCYDI